MSAVDKDTACSGEQGLPLQGHEKEKSGNLGADEICEKKRLKPKRKVCFPDDDHIVTQYFEPANPWQDVAPLSRAQLVQEYLESCRRHATSPIDSVLQQIRELPECTVESGSRYGRLSLASCSLLGPAPADALEALLRRARFRRIDIDHANIDDEGAEALFDMVEYYESAAVVSISGPRGFGVRGWQAVSRLLKKSCHLSELEVSSHPLEAGHAPVLARALHYVGCKLRVLALQRVSLAGEPLLNLVNSLKTNCSLRELRLGDNQLTCADASQLGALLRYNTRLQLLDLSNNMIQDLGVGYICSALAEQTEHAHSPPSAANSPLSPLQCPMAGYESRGLAVLVLWNNQLTRNCAQHLAKALTSKSLCVLNVGRNALGCSVRALAGGSLQSLGLQAAKLGPQHASALADLIRHDCSLQRLDLRDNKLGEQGLQAILHSLKDNSSLTQIDLDEPKESASLTAEGSLVTEARLTREIRARARRNEARDDEGEELDDVRRRRVHRKISLTCQSAAAHAYKSECEDRRSTHSGASASANANSRANSASASANVRLRSPLPSPNHSPAGSPVPHQTSRFSVTRVTPERESCPPQQPQQSQQPHRSSTSSSSSPTVARTSHSPTSRFKVVQVSEPPKIHVHTAEPRRSRFSVTRNYDSVYNPSSDSSASSPASGCSSPAPDLATDSPEPATHSPQPATYSPEPVTHSPEPATRKPRIAADHSPEPATLGPRLATVDPKLVTCSPEPATLDPRLVTNDPQLATHNPRVDVRDPKLATCSPEPIIYDKLAIYSQAATVSPEPVINQKPELNINNNRFNIIETSIDLDQGSELKTLYHFKNTDISDDAFEQVDRNDVFIETSLASKDHRAMGLNEITGHSDDFSSTESLNTTHRCVGATDLLVRGDKATVVGTDNVQTCDSRHICRKSVDVIGDANEHCTYVSENVNVKVDINVLTDNINKPAKVQYDQNVNVVGEAVETSVSGVNKCSDNSNTLDDSVKTETEEIIEVNKIIVNEDAAMKQIVAITEGLGNVIQQMRDLSTKSVLRHAKRNVEIDRIDKPVPARDNVVLKKNKSESSLDSPDLEVSRLMNKKLVSPFCDSSSSLDVSGSSMESINMDTQVPKPIIVQSVDLHAKLDRRKTDIFSAESSMDSNSDGVQTNSAFLNISVSSTDSVSPIFPQKKIHGSLSSLEASVSSMDSAKHDKVMVTSADSGIEHSAQHVTDKEDASSNEGTLTNNSSLKDNKKQDPQDTLTSPKRATSLLDVPALKTKSMDRVRKISWVAPSSSYHIPKPEPEKVETKLPSHLEKLLSLFQHPTSLFSRSTIEEEKKLSSSTPPRKDSSLTSSFWSWGSATEKEDKDELSDATDSTLSERVQVSFVDESFSKKLDSKTPSTDTENTLSEFQSIQGNSDSELGVTDTTEKIVQNVVIRDACDNKDLKDVYEKIIEKSEDLKDLSPRSFAAVLKSSASENSLEKQTSPEGQPVDKLPVKVIRGIKENISPENTLTASMTNTETLALELRGQKTNARETSTPVEKEELKAPIATIEETCEMPLDYDDLKFIDEKNVSTDSGVTLLEGADKNFETKDMTVDLGKDALSYLIYESQDFEPDAENVTDVKVEQGSLAQELKEAEIKEKLLDLSPELVIDEGTQPPFLKDLKPSAIPERAKLKKSNSLEDLLDKESPKTKTIAFKIPETTPRDIPVRPKLRSRSGSSPKSLPESFKSSPLAKLEKKKKKVSSLGKMAKDSLLALNMTEEEIAEFRRSTKLTSVESLKSLESVSEDANSQSGTSLDSRCRSCLRTSQESLISLDSITEDCRCTDIEKNKAVR